MFRRKLHLYQAARNIWNRLPAPGGLLLLGSCVLFSASACGTEVFDGEIPFAKTEKKATPKTVDLGKPKKANKDAASNIDRLANEKLKPQRWVLNPKASRVQLVVLKSTGQHIGRFVSVQGHLEGNKHSWTELFVVVDTPSLKTDVPAFGAHVRSAEFLNVKAHPKATYRSVDMNVARSSASGATQILRGELQLNGTKRPIQLPIWIRKDAAGHVEVSGHFNIDATQFNMSLPKIAEEMIDGVEIELDLRFLKAK